MIRTLPSRLIDSSRKEPRAGRSGTAPPAVNNLPSNSLTCRVVNGGGPNVEWIHEVVSLCRSSIQSSAPKEVVVRVKEGRGRGQVATVSCLAANENVLPGI